MGYTSYSSTARSTRANDQGYTTKSFNQVFEQQAQQKIHESMSVNGGKKRECRDSLAHPNATPIILGLDFTGSMGSIPHHFIKSGLPTLMGTLTENGVPDAAVLFLGIGDHKSDHFPLQAGQFESGDAELDMWLTRSFIEGNGGGNGGESYHLAWQFADEYVVTDAWEKRQKKGFIFTIGNEPIHTTLPKSFVKGLYGDCNWENDNKTCEELLAKAREKYHVFHIHLPGNSGNAKSLLGENLIIVEDYKEIPKIIARIIVGFEGVQQKSEVSDYTRPTEPETTETKPVDIIL